MNVNVKAFDGNTILHRAVQYSWGKVIPLLLEKGAQMNAKNAQGQTALYLALQQGNPLILNPFLEKEGPVDIEALMVARDEVTTDVFLKDLLTFIHKHQMVILFCIEQLGLIGIASSIYCLIEKYHSILKMHKVKLP